MLPRGQEFLAQLVTLYQGMARAQADQQTELSQTRRATAERDRLKTEAERLGKENEALHADHLALTANQRSQESRLAELTEQGEQLKALHAHMVEQTTRLAAGWSARREMLAADNQRLVAEIARVGSTLDLSLEREKQGRPRVYKLQDGDRPLRAAAGPVAAVASADRIGGRHGSNPP